MRVITGTARGRKLSTLEGDDVRPTTDKVKESLFNIIQFDVEGSCFLDLFAGSGQIGIEALSRGARSVTFVDKSKRSVDVIKNNIHTVGFDSLASVYNTDSLLYLERARGYDIAFLDPPYSTGLLERAMEKISDAMNDNGIVICECPANDELADSYGKFFKCREYIYGKMKLTTYTVPEEE